MQSTDLAHRSSAPNQFHALALMTLPLPLLLLAGNSVASWPKDALYEVKSEAKDSTPAPPYQRTSFIRWLPRHMVARCWIKARSAPYTRCLDCLNRSHHVTRTSIHPNEAARGAQTHFTGDEIFVNYLSLTFFGYGLETLNSHPVWRASSEAWIKAYRLRGFYTRTLTRAKT